ncbi:MAG: rod shape-determining protein, partial [Bdellovibrionales bacterium]|nr:rod shape-determining protein [Bdellovibrionales bacterium]
LESFDAELSDAIASGRGPDLIIISQGSVAYSASIPLGSQHITNDIAVGLRTPPHFAESLKMKYGCALSSLVDENETIEVEGVGGRRERTVLRQYLCEIIEPRAEEILAFANAEIQKSGLAQSLGAGIILTGGGSLLDGMLELGEFVFDLPVQKKTAKNFGGLVDAVHQPLFATSVGLVQFGQEKMKLKPVAKTAAGTGQNTTWMGRLKDMIDGAF